MTRLFDTIDTDLMTMKDTIVLFNCWEDWRGALECEALFDLYNEDDAKSWIDMYGVTAYRECVMKNRDWLGGANFHYDDKTKKVYTYPCVPFLVDEKENMIEDVCDNLEAIIIGVLNDMKSAGESRADAIKLINGTLDYTIDVSKWVDENNLYTEYVSAYGVNWRVIGKESDLLDDEDNWVVCTLPTGNLVMNNRDGYMFIKEANRVLLSYI